ncbi:hypothetical protein V2J09_013374 [Rumex salicifolius]
MAETRSVAAVRESVEESLSSKFESLMEERMADLNQKFDSKIDIRQVIVELEADPSAKKHFVWKDGLLRRKNKLLVAEVIGTYFIIFAGCGSVVANKVYNGQVTLPGICLTWGAIVAAMIYSVGHISGAHFNPAVTITFTVFGRFSYKQASLRYQNGTLALLYDVTPQRFFGTTPAGTTLQSFLIEIIISFLLMFAICATATDTKAIGDLSGLIVGLTIMLNVFVAGPATGASMNPARSIGPALVKGVYNGLWAYIFGPIIGTLLGAFAYNFIRLTDKPTNAR